MPPSTRQRLDAIISDRDAHAAKVKAQFAELKAARSRKAVRSLTLSGKIRRES
jgi:hypothetical protein